MLFQDAPQLLQGTAEDWQHGWREIETKAINLDFPRTTSVMRAKGDDLLDTKNIDIGSAIGEQDNLRDIDSPHHYFDDRRQELISTIEKLLPTPA